MSGQQWPRSIEGHDYAGARPTSGSRQWWPRRPLHVAPPPPVYPLAPYLFIQAGGSWSGTGIAQLIQSSAIWKKSGGAVIFSDGPRTYTMDTSGTTSVSLDVPPDVVVPDLSNLRCTLSFSGMTFSGFVSGQVEIRFGFSGVYASGNGYVAVPFFPGPLVDSILNVQASNLAGDNNNTIHISAAVPPFTLDLVSDDTTVALTMGSNTISVAIPT